MRIKRALSLSIISSGKNGCSALFGDEVSTESGSDRATIIRDPDLANKLDPVATALGTDSMTPTEIRALPNGGIIMNEIISSSRMLLMLSAIAICFAAVAFARAGKQDFVLHNETGVEIHELYVSPHSSNNWGEDVLGQDTLPAGKSVKITFDDQEKSVKWDLKVDDGNKHTIEWENLDLSKISEVTLHYKEGKAWADVK